MAFNLFKRKTIADTIFKNGTIYTMDAENPVVTSIACSDGIIIATGEDAIIEEYQDKHTRIIDLQGKFILPGFIERDGQTVNQIFDDSYLKLDEAMSIDNILSSLLTFKTKHPHYDCYAAYGYNESLIESNIQMQMREAFDQISNEKPVIAIASDGIHLLLNSIAVEIIQQKAEEIQIPVITPNFAVEAIICPDYATLIRNTLTEAYKAVQKGYTCTFNKGTFYYFENTYRNIQIDLFQADMIKQRSFASFLLNRQFHDRQVFHLMDQGRTTCSELEGKINFDTLYIQCSGDKSKPNYMSNEYLSGICAKAADKGYNILISAFDKPSTIDALNILGNLQPSYKKSAFSVEHAEILTEEELSHIFTDNIRIFDKNSSLNNKDTQSMIDELTVKGAEYLGISDVCGSLEQGKRADFAVYPNDPAAIATESDLKRLKADMVILNGKIIYKNGEDSVEDWIKKMTEHFSSIDEEFSL